MPPNTPQPPNTQKPQAEKAEVANATRGPLGNIVDWARRQVNSVVANSPLPTSEGLGYQSSIRVYGATLKKKNDGRLVYSNLGIANRIDVLGDGLLRTVDDNAIRSPIAMLLRHPRTFAKLVFGRGKRYRGSAQDILANVERLGLGDDYGPVQGSRNEIEVKNRELYTHGIAMQDIYRQEEIGHEALKGIDRFDALTQAGGYLDGVHRKHGAVGEFNLYHVLFRKKGVDGRVKEPAQTLPDIVWNPKRNTGELEKRAIDVLDMLASTACEEYRRSKDPALIAKALDAVIAGYTDVKVITITESLARRGRLTLPPQATDTERAGGFAFVHGVFAQHNVQRLGIDKHSPLNLRTAVIEACERWIAAKAKPTPAKK